MIFSGTASVDAIAEDIKQQRDKADAKFEMAMGTMDNTLEDRSRDSRASARLAQIRKRLGVPEEEAAETVEPTLDMSEEELALLDLSS